MAEKQMNSDDLRKMMDKIFESQKDEIYEQMRNDSPFRNVSIGFDPAFGNDATGIYVHHPKDVTYRPQGSTDLIDPNGVVVMRDGEVVAEPLHVRLTTRAYRRK